MHLITNGLLFLFDSLSKVVFSFSDMTHYTILVIFSQLIRLIRSNSMVFNLISMTHFSTLGYIHTIDSLTMSGF